MALSDKKPDQLNEKIDGFAQKYRLWLVIPLVVSGLLAFKNLSVGIGFFLFSVFVWLFIWAIGKTLNAFRLLLPQSLSQDHRKAICEAGAATLFLAGFTSIGVVLRNENFVSVWLAEKLPGGMSFGFIDPTFAAFALLCIWAYTGYLLRR